MRLWSVHPEHLDRAGLLAVWREGLLAKAVLEGKTIGYKNHPQLARFKGAQDPMLAINHYLHCVVDEAERRGYKFDRTKLTPRVDVVKPLPVNDQQLAYEWQHLQRKLALRDPERAKTSKALQPKTHPIFDVIDGPIEDWEKI